MMESPGHKEGKTIKGVLDSCYSIALESVLSVC